MRSRIAITALLASGALLSSGGAAIGVSALSTTLDAGQAQYGPVDTTSTATAPPPRNGTLGDDDADSTTTPAAGGTKNAGDESAPSATVQPARQLEAGDRDELPFTGYAAIPLVLLGVFLLASGLVLRRGTSGSQVT